MNRNFAKINASGELDYPPDAMVVDGRIVAWPTPAQLEAAGYLPVVDEPPQTDADHYAVPTGWQVAAGAVRRVYEVRANPPPPPRVFRRSYLAQWIRGAGKWSAFAAFLADPAADDLAFLWEYCTEFDEDSPLWPAALAAIKAALSLTDAEAEAMLDFGATGVTAQ